MKLHVEARMARDGHASAGEYLRSLIAEDQRHEARRGLDVGLLEGLQGPSPVMTEADWDAIEREALEGLAGESLRP